MTALIAVLSVVGYLTAGIGLARLRAWYVLRHGRQVNREELKIDMVVVLFAWPVIVPLFGVVSLLRLVLFPRRLR